jgi:hypothetical protein
VRKEPLLPKLLPFFVQLDIVASQRDKVPGENLDDRLHFLAYRIMVEFVVHFCYAARRLVSALSPLQGFSDPSGHEDEPHKMTSIALNSAVLMRSDLS